MYYSQKGCRYLYINLRKTLNQIENALPPEGVQDLSKLQKAYEVTLRLHSQIIGVIYDKFGEDTKIIRTGEKTIVANVKVQTSPTFFGWLFQFAGQMKVLSPDTMNTEYKKLAAMINE